MKKLSLVSFFLVFFVFFAFGQQEEIDYLLFLPNSGSRFVNETQAMIQLDNLARYLLGRDLSPGQIYVYGYAAFALNDVDPVRLSRERALFVISELQRRGVSGNLFSDPVAHGSVDLWGGNTNEEERSPNRRVRVVLDGNIVTPEIVRESEPEIVISAVEAREPTRDTATEKPSSEFPWWLLLLLLLIAALIYLLSRRKKSPVEKPAKPVTAKPAVKTEPAQPVTAKPAEPVKPAEPAEPAVKAEPIKPAFVTSKKTVNLDEEIRLRAYEFYLERGSVDGDAEGDWYRALIDVSAKYKAAGYQVYFEDEYWWASLQETKPA